MDFLKKLTLKNLIEVAYPQHEVSLAELREHAYDIKIGVNATHPRNIEIVQHLQACARCQEKLRIMRATDQLLNGEWEKRRKIDVDSLGNEH